MHAGCAPAKWVAFSAFTTQSAKIISIKKLRHSAVIDERKLHKTRFMIVSSRDPHVPLRALIVARMKATSHPARFVLLVGSLVLALVAAACALDERGPLTQMTA